MNINTSILNFFLTSFVCLGFLPFSHHISKDSSWLWVSQIFLVSDNLDSLKDAWSVFCRWSLNWDLSDVFLNRPGCGFLGRRPQRLRQWHPTPVTLAWRIPGTEEHGGLQSMGSWRVRHDWSDLAALHYVQYTYPIINMIRSPGWGGVCFRFLHCTVTLPHFSVLYCHHLKPTLKEWGMILHSLGGGIST